MLDHDHVSQCRLQVVTPPSMPIAEMMIGKPVDEVVELMPRLFNLCRSAQSLAIRMALGVETRPEDTERLAEEIWSEHLLRLAVTLPMKLGMKPMAVSGANKDTLAQTLFGADHFPNDLAGFIEFTKSDIGIAPVLRSVISIFEPKDACPEKLPFASDLRMMNTLQLENSVGARHADHPVMRHVEATCGRGPFWRIVARALDFDAALAGRLFEPRMLDECTAMVPAARGLYAVRARREFGRVVFLQRVTPTDHLLAQNGVFEQSIAGLKPEKQGYASLLVDILDPCVPVSLKECGDA